MKKCLFRTHFITILKISYIWHNFIQLCILLGTRKYKAISQPNLCKLCGCNCYDSRIKFCLPWWAFVSINFWSLDYICFYHYAFFKFSSFLQNPVSNILEKAETPPFVSTTLVNLSKTHIACRGPSNSTTIMQATQAMEPSTICREKENYSLLNDRSCILKRFLPSRGWRRVQDGGYMCTHGWLMSMYGKTTTILKSN